MDEVHPNVEKENFDYSSKMWLAKSLGASCFFNKVLNYLVHACYEVWCNIVTKLCA